MSLFYPNDPRFKQPLNTISRAYVAEEWLPYWDSLVACVPVHTGANPPIEIISGREMIPAATPDVFGGEKGFQILIDENAGQEDFHVPISGIAGFPITLFCFIRYDDPTGSQEAFFDLADSASSSRNINLLVGNTTNRNAGFVMRNGGFSPAFSTTEPAQGEWYTTAAVWRSQTDAELYVNGVSVLTNNFNAAFFTPDRLTIGRFGDSSPGNNIGLGAFAIGYVWSRGLLDSEILKLDSNPFGPVSLDYSKFFGVVPVPVVGGRIMSSLTRHGGLAGAGGIAGKGGGLSG